MNFRNKRRITILFFPKRKKPHYPNTPYQWQHKNHYTSSAHSQMVLVVWVTVQPFLDFFTLDLQVVYMKQFPIIDECE
jgi:hypothetical protein